MVTNGTLFASFAVSVRQSFRLIRAIRFYISIEMVDPIHHVVGQEGR
jgi:hypothetical protein